MADIDIKPLDELPTIENDSSHAFVIETHTYNSISYDDFFNNHMRKNIPCIIKNIGNDWEASKNWAQNDHINYDYLTNKYGYLIVPVYDCKNLTFDHQPKSDMKFSDYVSYWKENVRDKSLYLKDWHLRRCKPDDNFYTVPKLFGSDWLNEYAQDNQEDDFIFVYMGPPGSWTPLHADVYSSFSWSVNVSGKKRWVIFPPGEEEKLNDEFNVVTMQFDPEKYKDKDVTYYEIIQGTGDAIFVPSGWYHQVENESDTISINHNWINGTNLLTVWQALAKMLVKVQKQIDDLKDLDEFPSICQKLLKTYYGMDCVAFAKLIAHIGEKRVSQIDGGSNITFNKYTLGKNHCMYDLKCIKEVVNLMMAHPVYDAIDVASTEKFIVLSDCLSNVV